MAIIQSDSPFSAIRGCVGGLVFKQVSGKTVISQRPSTSRKESMRQRKTREKFRYASSWARLILATDPEKKLYYQNKAKELQLPNAYTAAVRDYMKRVTITR